MVPGDQNSSDARVGLRRREVDRAAGDDDQRDRRRRGAGHGFEKRLLRRREADRGAVKRLALLRRIQPEDEHRGAGVPVTPSIA